MRRKIGVLCLLLSGCGSSGKPAPQLLRDLEPTAADVPHDGNSDLAGTAARISSQFLLKVVPPDGSEDGNYAGEGGILFTDVTMPMLSQQTELRQLSRASVRVTLLAPDGSAILDEYRPGGSSNWELVFPTEGLYSITVSVEHPDKDILSLPPTWTQELLLDRTAPELRAQASLSTDPVSGDRTAAVSVLLPGESGGECDAVAIRSANQSEHQSTGLLVPGIASAEGFILQNPSVVVDANISLPLVVHFSCRDPSGNLTQVVVPIEEDRLDYRLLATVDAQSGVLEGTERTVAFVRPPSARMFLKLMQLGSDQELAPSVVERERGKLKVYISELAKNPDNLAEKDRSEIAYAWNHEVVYPFMEGRLGDRTLHITLTKTEGDEPEMIISTQEVSVFIDRRGAMVSWLSVPQFAPALKDASLSLSLRLDVEGAPLQGVPSAQYSSDGELWHDLALTDWLATGSSGEFAFSVRYPFTDERAFRIRLKTLDLAGNDETSSPSPNLIGSIGLNTIVDESERTSCKRSDGTTPASRLAPVLASGYLCRMVDSAGQPTDQMAAAVVVVNRGGVAAFADGSRVLGARLTVGGTNERWLSFSSSLFSTPESVRTPVTLFISLDDAELASESLALEFDIDSENTDTQGRHLYSTERDSACYAYDGIFRPTVVLKDSASGVALRQTPFLCSEL